MRCQVAITLLIAACTPPPADAISIAQSRLYDMQRQIAACYAVPRCDAVAPKVAIAAFTDEAKAVLSDAQATLAAGNVPSTDAIDAALQKLASLLDGLPGHHLGESL